MRILNHKSHINSTLTQLKPIYIKTVRSSLSLIIILLISVLTNNRAQSKKNLEYLPNYRFSLVDNIDFDKLTPLNIAFANPTADTNIIVSKEDYDYIIDMAHHS